MRNPQLLRAFPEGRKVSCNPAQQGWNSSFVARSNSLYEINLMMPSFPAADIGALLATEERRRKAS